MRSKWRKDKNLFSVLLIIITFQSALSQKVMNEIADDVCDCLKKEFKKDSEVDMGYVISSCTESSIMMKEKELRKEFGDNFFENSDEVYLDFGYDIAKILTKECEFFMDMAFKNELTKSDEASNFFEKAEKLTNEGIYYKALDNYNKAIQLNPENHEYYNSRGILYFKMEDYYRAIADFLSAIQLAPENHINYYNIAYSIYQLGDMENALIHTKQAIEVNPDYCDSYNLNGLIYDHMQRYDSAFVYFHKAATCDSSNHYYSYNVGSSLYQMENYEQAIDWFLVSYHYDSTDIDLISYLGNCYNNINDFNKAIKYHTKHIRLSDSTNYIPFYNRGMSLFNLDKHESALADFMTAYQLDSTDLDVIYYLAEINKRLDNMDKARKFYNKLVKQQPDNALFYDYRAEYFTETGEYERALNDYQISMTLYPDDCEIYKRISKIYNKMDMKQKADENLQKAVELGCEAGDG